jgi:hypothetical protein
MNLASGSVFRKTVSIKSDNVVVLLCFTRRSTAAAETALLTAVATRLQTTWSIIALCRKSLLMSLLLAIELPSLRQLFSPFHTLLICPAWDTLLVAILPPA